MVLATIIDGETGKEESREFPSIKEAFPYLGNVNIIKSELYMAFPTGYVSEIGDEPFASGGQLLTDDRGNEFSRNLYVRWDTSGHSNTNDHFNINLITRHKQTKKKKETELFDSHFIEPGNLPKFIFITVSEDDESFTQPVVFLPKQEDKEYYDKQKQFLKKVREGKLTKEDENIWKKAFEKYAESLRGRKKFP